MSRERLLFVGAAALTAATLALPLWGFRMSAPQYPDEALHLQVTRSGITGDVHEVETLQQYIGVRFPTDLPELAWVARATLALAALLLAGAFAGASRIGRASRLAGATLLVTFLAASAAVVQARLYEVGHLRDPHAPLRGLHDFTPPLVGPVQVGNFTVWSFPHAGGLLLLVAATFAVAGTRRSDPRRAPAGSSDGRESGKAVA